MNNRAGLLLFLVVAGCKPDGDNGGPVGGDPVDTGDDSSEVTCNPTISNLSALKGTLDDSRQFVRFTVNYQQGCADVVGGMVKVVWNGLSDQPYFLDINGDDSSPVTLDSSTFQLSVDFEGLDSTATYQTEVTVIDGDGYPSNTLSTQFVLAELDEIGSEG